MNVRNKEIQLGLVAIYSGAGVTVEECGIPQGGELGSRQSAAVKHQADASVLRKQSLSTSEGANRHKS